MLPKVEQYRSVLLAGLLIHNFPLCIDLRKYISDAITTAINVGIIQGSSHVCFHLHSALDWLSVQKIEFQYLVRCTGLRVIHESSPTYQSPVSLFFSWICVKISNSTPLSVGVELSSSAMPLTIIK